MNDPLSELLSQLPSWDSEEPEPEERPPRRNGRKVSDADRAYWEAIQRTRAMVGDPEAQALAARYGLVIRNITWEDTGRYWGSAVGPNISDMTIQVEANDPRTGAPKVNAMPVIQHDNLRDLTADVDPMAFTLWVGNERGRRLKRVSLYEFLREPARYLSDPDSWPAERKTLLAPRDLRVLVSAQACFLPIPREGKATFNPVLFNYQSSRRNPAVLAILATREGTSVTVIDNVRDAFCSGGVWGQRLFHNHRGKRASLTGTRASEFLTDASRPEPSVAAGEESGLGVVLLVQVPLKQDRHVRRYSSPGILYSPGAVYYSASCASDVEEAVIGHGKVEGPFTEMDGLPAERDPNFPVRVTVQFYKATSNGVVSEADLAAIRAQIDRVYSAGDVAGSLVTDGAAGRITEYHGAKVQPPSWWEEFWDRYETNTGVLRTEAIERLRELLGTHYRRRRVSDLYVRDLLRAP